MLDDCSDFEDTRGGDCDCRIVESSKSGIWIWGVLVWVGMIDSGREGAFDLIWVKALLYLNDLTNERKGKNERNLKTNSVKKTDASQAMKQVRKTNTNNAFLSDTMKHFSEIA